MAWGTVTIGGMELRETFTAGEDPAGLRIAGQEAHPPKTLVHVESVHLNLAGLAAAAKDDPSLFVPVVFSDKAALTGFFRLGDARSELTRIHGGSYLTAVWQATLERIGNAFDVEIESRVPLIARAKDAPITTVPVFWHAPAIGATSYVTGTASAASFVDRPGADGIIRVYTGLPMDAPRWTIRAEDYLRGASRLYVDTVRRLGRLTVPAALWELHNNLVRVTPGPNGSIVVTCWDNGGWRSPHTFFVNVNGVGVTTQPELTILRNEPEETVVRLTYPTVDGRVTLDLGLRRGARFVTGVLKRHSAAALGMTRSASVPFTVVTGGLRQTTADADGNRFVLGSARSTDASVGWPYLQKSGVLRFDFFLGHEVGDPAPAGDAYADLLAQYLGSTGELVRVVRR